MNTQIIKNCSECKNKEIVPNIGLTCGLTKEKPHYQNYCEHFDPDFYLITTKIREENIELKGQIRVLNIFMGICIAVWIMFTLIAIIIRLSYM